ncbi:hypothetical protein BDY24DRAFT_440686 [Mrakia frigida]|uniref:uncharacterized protein n=1 Tax=Mrakia frigida TaxID=29902 RepID=UPI003FCC0A2C
MSSHEEDDFSSSDDEHSSYSASEASFGFSPATSSFSPLTPTSLRFPLSDSSLSVPATNTPSTSGYKGQISTSTSSQALGRKEKSTDHSSAATIVPRTAIPPGGVLPPSILEQGFNSVGEPRRPMNGFSFDVPNFEARPCKYQELKTGEISSILSVEWKGMDKTSKEFYLGQATSLKAAFDARYPDYKYVRRPNGSRKKGSRGGKTYIPRSRVKQQTLVNSHLGKSSSSSALGLGGMLNESEPTRWVQNDDETDGSYQGDGGKHLHLVEQSGDAVRSNGQQPRRVGLVPSGRASSGASNDRLARRTTSQPYPTPSDIYPPPRSTQRSPSSNISPPTNFSSAPRRLIAIPSVPSLNTWSSSSPSSGFYEKPQSLAEIRSLPSNRPSYAPPPPYPSTPVSSTFPPSDQSITYQSESYPYPTSNSNPSTARAQKQVPLLVRGWAPPPVGLGFGSRAENEMKMGMESGVQWRAGGNSRSETEWRTRGGSVPTGGRVEQLQQPAQQPRWEPAPLQSPFLPSTHTSSSSFGSAHLPHFHPNFGQAHSLAYNDVPPPAGLSTPSISPYIHPQTQSSSNSHFNYPPQPPLFHLSPEHPSQQHVGRSNQFNYPPPSTSYSHPNQLLPTSPNIHQSSSFTDYRSNHVSFGQEEHVVSNEIWTGGSNSPNVIEALKPYVGNQAFGSFPEGERWRV